MQPPATCPACGAAPRAGRRLRPDVRLRECPHCRLAWWNWTALDPAAFYDAAYFQSRETDKGYNDYAALEPALRRTAEMRVRRLVELLGKRAAANPRVFEIGCGTGVFLNVARQRGWDVEGVEVSGYAAERARQRGLKVVTATAEASPPAPGTFDAVVLWDVIEHLPDPVGTLRLAARGLRPGGVLALSTGDVTSWCARLSGARWHLYTLPEHLFFFSPAALVRLLERVGIRVGSVLREVNWVSLEYAFERLRKTLPGGRWLPHAGATVLLPATLYDVLGVYGRKRPVCNRDGAADARSADE